jgi:hypothetical protein
MNANRGTVLAFGNTRTVPLSLTNVEDVKFYDYINLRDFTRNSVSTSGSPAPEGLNVVEAKDNPTSRPLLIVANEVSGNVNIFEIH